jgi:intraflagellar transport protein 140
MKSLLKSGDTEKIVFFAGMTRQREIYVMAGNYLQSLDWQNNPRILKNIVSFYTKGQAFDLLANFYTVSAQAEIDEFRDYVKALKALQEAAKSLVRISQTHAALETLKSQVLNIKRFLELQEMAERREFPNVAVACRNLLSSDEKLVPVRPADVLAMLIEAQVSMRQFPDALATLKELAMKQPDWSSRELVDKSLIEKLAVESGIDSNTLWNSGRNPLKKQRSIDQSDDDEIDDDDEEDEIEENLE